MTFLPDVFGHESAKEQLSRMLEQDRVPNGVLLHGEAGRGKRTLAMAFARAMVGTGVDDHPDLFVVTRGEDQRLVGIDRVRALKQEFSLTPAQSDRRVAVVVDAERLTDEAGNALLKLLEEPPPRSHIILTARDRDAVMETLVSRCRSLRVPPLSRREVLSFLEVRGVAADRARLLALLAEGRPGYAIGLAEDGFEDRVLAPTFRLLLPGGSPHQAAEEVVALAREGTKKAEGARERIRLVLGTVAWFLRASLKASVGATDGQKMLELLEPPLRESLSERGPVAVERQLERVLEAMGDVDRNVGIELVLEDLIPAIA